MKTIFRYFVFFVLLGSFSYAQLQTTNSNYNQTIKFNSNVYSPFTTAELQMLKEVYGTALDKEILNRPTRVLMVKEILRNRVVLEEITDPNKHKPCPLLSEIPVFDAFIHRNNIDRSFDPNAFNPLKYDFPYHHVGYQRYRVDNTNYFITIKPQHYNSTL